MKKIITIFIALFVLSTAKSQVTDTLQYLTDSFQVKKAKYINKPLKNIFKDLKIKIINFSGFVETPMSFQGDSIYVDNLEFYFTTDVLEKQVRIYNSRNSSNLTAPLNLNIPYIKIIFKTPFKFHQKLIYDEFLLRGEKWSSFKQRFLSKYLVGDIIIGKF